MEPLRMVGWNPLAAQGCAPAGGLHLLARSNMALQLADEKGGGCKGDMHGTDLILCDLRSSKLTTAAASISQTHTTVSKQSSDTPGHSAIHRCPDRPHTAQHSVQHIHSTAPHSVAQHTQRSTACPPELRHDLLKRRALLRRLRPAPLHQRCIGGQPRLQSRRLAAWQGIRWRQLQAAARQHVGHQLRQGGCGLTVPRCCTILSGALQHHITSERLQAPCLCTRPFIEASLVVIQAPCPAHTAPFEHLTCQGLPAP